MWGHTRMENECSETKERAEKQLLTVNSVNPSCSSAFDIFFKTIYPLFSFPQKEIGKAHHQNALFIITRPISIPYNNQFAEAIVYIQKRSLLMIYLLLIRQGVSRLDIEAFIMTVHHEIYLKIPTLQFAILIQNEQFLKNLSFRMNTFAQNLSFRMNRFLIKCP